MQLEGSITFVRLQATLKWLAFSFTGRPRLPGAGRWGLFSDMLCRLNRCSQEYPHPTCTTWSGEEGQTSLHC